MTLTKEQIAEQIIIHDQPKSSYAPDFFCRLQIGDISFETTCWNYDLEVVTQIAVEEWDGDEMILLPEEQKEVICQIKTKQDVINAIFNYLNK